MRSFVWIAPSFFVSIDLLARLASAREDALVFGSSAAGTGQIVVQNNLPQPVELPASIFPGLPGYATGALGLHSTVLDEPDEGLFQFTPAADFRLILLAKDPSMELWTGTSYLSVGGSFFVGAAPFDTHPIFEITSGSPGNSYGLMLKLTDLNHVYQDSDPFVLSFTPLAPRVWNVDDDGNWSDAGNWTTGVPNAAGATASLGPIITAPRTITVDSPRTVGAVAFDNPNKYTIAGSATLSLDSTSGGVAINVTTGSHEVTAPVVPAKNVTFTVTSAGSTLSVSNLQSSSVSLTKAGAGNLAVNNARATSLTINAGTASVLANGGNAGVSKVTSLTIAGGATPTATLDLNDNDLVVGNATPKATIEAQVKNARNNGLWNQPGITSTTARTNPQGSTGLGVLSGAEYHTAAGGTGTFSGQAYFPGNTLVKYTWNGDANLDGTVNFDDYVKIDVGFNTNLTGWLNGDFNYSAQVNFDDYVLIDVAFNTQSGTLARAIDYLSGDDRSESGLDDPAVRKVVEHLDQFGLPYGSAFLAAVPEPASVATLGLGAVAVSTRLRVRRRTDGGPTHC